MSSSPSICITPNAYKAGKLYSIVPTDGAGDLDVVRATGATRVNEQGLIELVGNNIPRLDYTNASCPSILVEPQRTNLLLRSEQFNDASWVKTNTTVTENQTISPDGTNTADLIISTSTNNARTIQTSTIVSGTTYSITFYAKQNTQRFIYIRFTSNASTNNYVSAVFDLQDGTVGQTSIGSTSGTLISATATSAANGFYRITLVASIDRTDGNFGIGFASAKTGNTFNSAGSITSEVTNGNSLFLWGAQLEQGSNATSYIPTTTATVTRNADVISKSGVSSLIGQAQGTLYVEASSFNFLGTGAGERISLTDGTFNNRVNIDFSSNGIVTMVVSFNNVQIAGTIASTTGVITPNNRFKIAAAYDGSNSRVYVNGVAFTTITGTVPTFSGQLNKVEFDQGNNVRPFYGRVNNLIVYPTRLSNAELQQLTTL